MTSSRLDQAARLTAEASKGRVGPIGAVPLVGGPLT